MAVIGSTLQGRYKILMPLSKGGMGAIYLVRDKQSDAHLALKENRSLTAADRRQFKREAKILQSIEHPHIPKFTDYFEDDHDGQFLVMEYVEGTDLDELVRRRRQPFPEDKVLAWADQLLDALQHLHSQKPPIIHRDVKPANLKLTPEGQIKLVDFGISKVYHPEQSTASGAQGFTPHFAPREQYQRKERTDARTDVYSVGATLYYLLTRKLPPSAPDRMIDRVSLVAVRKHNPAVSVNTERVLLKAMELTSSDRYPSARAMRKALQGA
jgi:serine/threonine protein kinase